MISQDLVDTAIDQFSQFSNDLPWSFVLKVDILSIAWIRLNKAYTIVIKLFKINIVRVC